MVKRIMNELYVDGSSDSIDKVLHQMNTMLQDEKLTNYKIDQSFYQNPEVLQSILISIRRTMKFVKYGELHRNKKKLKKKLERVIHSIESGKMDDIICEGGE